MTAAATTHPVVLDSGSGSCKAGFAGDAVPLAVFSSMVGRPKYKRMMMRSHENEDRYVVVGEVAQAKRATLKIRYPVQRGSVVHWDDMERLWHHAFHNELRVTPEEHPVLLTESPLTPRANREKAAQVMFETFKIPSMHVGHSGELSLYAFGRTTGLAVDSGDGVSYSVPVYQGYTLDQAVRRINLAGSDVTDNLVRLLTESGHDFSSTAEREIARDIKERLCRVALNFEHETTVEETYLLPDGNGVRLGQELFRAPEVLFTPSLLGKEAGGIHSTAAESVAGCDLDLRRDLYRNVVLSGGSTLLSGFAGRLQKELTGLSDSCPVEVTSVEKRKHAVWVGGAVMASHPTFKDMCVTRAEYEENGPTIVHRKNRAETRK